MDPSNTQAVLLLKTTKPRTVDDVRKLIGLLGYYRKYTQDFSRIAQPLFELPKKPSVKLSRTANPRRRRIQKGNSCRQATGSFGHRNTKKIWNDI